MIRVATACVDNPSSNPRPHHIDGILTIIEKGKAGSKAVAAESSKNFPFEIIKELGRGGFGRALLAARKAPAPPGGSGHNNLVVLKQIEVAHLSYTERAQTLKESHIMESLDHENVASIVQNPFIHDGHLNIVLEYANGGDLAQAIERKSKETGGLLGFSEPLTLLIFAQVCAGVSYIHDNKIVHRDIKSQNILIFRGPKNTLYKICDFGISKTLSTMELCHTFIGSPHSLAPEVCEGLPYHKPSDIWSLGTLLYQTHTSRHAFEGKTFPALVIKIAQGKFRVPKVCSSFFRRLLSSCLQTDPKARPTINGLLSYLKKAPRRAIDKNTTYKICRPPIDTKRKENRVGVLMSTIEVKMARMSRAKKWEDVRHKRAAEKKELEANRAKTAKQRSTERKRRNQELYLQNQKLKRRLKSAGPRLKKPCTSHVQEGWSVELVLSDRQRHHLGIS